MEIETMQNNTTKMANKTFIERALEQILADKDISRSHHLQLKKACESALGMYINIALSYQMFIIRLYNTSLLITRAYVM